MVQYPPLAIHIIKGSMMKNAGMQQLQMWQALILTTLSHYRDLQKMLQQGVMIFSYI